MKLTLKSNKKYSAELCAEVYKLMSAGLSDIEVMAQWGISKDTFYRWKREKPEFKEAHERGQVAFDAQHEAIGKMGMMKTVDVDYQFWRDLGKYRHGWTDKQPDSTNNTQININILKQQSNKELIEYIKQNIELVPELGIIEHEEPGKS